ncbi:MAG: peptidoglycan recognition protein family protein, partial [Pseudonocardiaceae bacterium]
MSGSQGIGRRSLCRTGLAVTAIGSLATGLARTAHADRRRVPRPTVFRTRNWDARPPAEPIVVEDHPPTYIVVHHTVEPGNGDDYSLAHSFEMSRAIQSFHMDHRGWIDSGQQFTISRGGHITEGRHRSLEILDEGLRHVQGTNVRDNNSQVIGIENEGLYTSEDVPQALWDALVDLVSYMAYQYDVQPEFIKGHRDFNSTQCPGDVLYARLPELRAGVAARLGTRVAARTGDTTEWPLLRPGDRGRDVEIAQRLLRDRGASSVPTDGIYGPSTQDAVRALAAEHGLDSPGCSAAARSEESGYLGADLWPLLITRQRSTR